MLEHSCRRAGAEGCGFTATAETEEELLAEVARHAQEVHGLERVTATIAAYLRDSARST